MQRETECDRKQMINSLRTTCISILIHFRSLDVLLFSTTLRLNVALFALCEFTSIINVLTDVHIPTCGVLPGQESLYEVCVDKHLL